jgi:hypothetical protein
MLHVLLKLGLKNTIYFKGEKAKWPNYFIYRKLFQKRPNWADLVTVAAIRDEK